MADYCVQNGIPGPKYTRRGHVGEHRYSVEIQGRPFIGTSACHGEWDSKNGCAHTAMYSTLVFGNGMTSKYPPVVTLRRSKESMLALVPRLPNGVTGSTISANHAEGLKRESDHDVASSCDGPPKKAKTGDIVEHQVQKGRRVNANLVPVNNRRLADIQVPKQKVEKRWPLTPHELEEQLAGLKSHTQRLESMFPLLASCIPH